MEQTGHPNPQASRYFRININKHPSAGTPMKEIPGSARARVVTPRAGTALVPLSKVPSRKVPP